MSCLLPARSGTTLHRRIIAIYSLLLLGNLAAWASAFLLFRDQPLLLGTALLAYGFGLRHAVDADHIAAIDNVTRTLMQEGRPVGVGFFFALGHSTIVIVAAVLVAGTTSAMAEHFSRFKELGGVVSTSVSALFLFAIAAMNLVILRGVWRSFRHIRAGGAYVPEDLDLLLNRRGLLARLFRPLFRMVTQSWLMFPLGFLFGLGFDTATEVALLAVSGTQAAQGWSIGSIMVFPALFAAGMSLIDTTDGILMLGAYDWAFVKPMRKLFYNLTITFVSVLVAFVVGGIETLGLIGRQLALGGWFWDGIALLAGNFSAMGFLIIGLFGVTWLGSMVLYRYSGLDRLDIRAGGALMLLLAGVGWAASASARVPPSEPGSTGPDQVVVTAPKLEEQIPAIPEQQGVRVDTVTADEVARDGYVDIAEALCSTGAARPRAAPRNGIRTAAITPTGTSACRAPARPGTPTNPDKFRGGAPCASSFSSVAIWASASDRSC